MKKVLPAVGAAVVVIVLIVVGISLAGNKSPDAIEQHKLAITTHATISVADKTTGNKLSGTAFGLSLESSELTKPQFGQGNFAGYLKTLGAGTLRIGGNTVDTTFWTSKNEPAPKWSTGTITPADIDRLAKVAKDSGWTVILGVNLKHVDAARAADETAVAQKALGTSLRAVAIGNEPSIYYSDFATFTRDFDTYVAAIKAAAPSINIDGSDSQHSSAAETIAIPFAQQQAKAKQIAALTEHYYPQTACGNASTSLAGLLSSDTYTASKDNFDAFVKRAKQAGVPPVLDETNSVSCEGKAGVSDRFGSALWAFGAGLEATHEGIAGVDFHGSLAQCGSAKPAYMFYTPLCASSKANANKGNVEATPEYYGLLALHKMGSGDFLNVTNANFRTIHAFAIQDGKKMSIAIINLNEGSVYSSTEMTVTIPAGYTKALQTNLETYESPTLEAKANVYWGNGLVNAKGNLANSTSSPLQVDGTTVVATIPNAGATIINLN